MPFQLGENPVAAKNVTLRDNGDGSLSFFSGTYEKLRFKSDGSLVAKQPTQTILTVGSGTYYTPPNCLRLRVRMVGGGGGGCGITAGTTGGASDFGGTTFALASGGARGAASGQGGAGGAASFTATASVFGFAAPGAAGWPSDQASGANYVQGGHGGRSVFGGAGHGSVNEPGYPAAANSGSGGGGGSDTAALWYSEAAGGAGGYVDITVNDPRPSYTYVVGAKGIGGEIGANIYPGGDGGDGLIIVDEFYV